MAISLAGHHNQRFVCLLRHAVQWAARRTVTLKVVKPLGLYLCDF
jgi:hypothetical protein